MYSLLQPLFKIFFIAASPRSTEQQMRPGHALGCRDLGLAHAEKIVLVHTPGLRGRELGQCVIEGKGGFLCPMYSSGVKGWQSTLTSKPGSVSSEHSPFLRFCRL